MWIDRTPTNWSFKASRHWYACQCPSIYKMSKAYDGINAAHLDPVEMSGGNYKGRQSIMPDDNQRLPQHDADHVPVRTYKEIGDAPEHVTFASHHQAACLLDLEGSIISRVHWTSTLWPRRHGQPPTIGPPEHKDDQPKPDLQDVRGWSI